MKKVSILIPIFGLQLFTACVYFAPNEDRFVEPVISSYEPVIMGRTDFENAIELQKPQAVQKSGKIYSKGNYLFINDNRKGFHIYDNSDPLSPVPIKFLSVPGATDLAIRNNVYFINQATDLVALSFDPNDQKIINSKRIKNVFPILISPEGDYPTGIKDNQIVVNWTLKNK